MVEVFLLPWWDPYPDEHLPLAAVLFSFGTLGLVFGVLAGRIARDRGHRFWPWFCAYFLVGFSFGWWTIPLLLVPLSSRDRAEEERRRVLHERTGEAARRPREWDYRDRAARHVVDRSEPG